MSAARLYQYEELLALLGDADRLADTTYREALARQVVEVLRAEIAAIQDPVDRRIAQAVLAATPEFYDKFVYERKAYVASHDHGFTDEQYKTRRGQVIADLAEALQAFFFAGPATADSALLRAQLDAAPLHIPPFVPSSFPEHPDSDRGLSLNPPKDRLRSSVSN